MLIENTCPPPQSVSANENERGLASDSPRVQLLDGRAAGHKQVIAGNCEVLEQGRCLLQQLTDTQYTSAVETYACSSIGAHFRHMLDMYLAVMPALAARNTAQVVDYDVRRRGAQVETCRHAAIAELDKFRQQLDGRTTRLDTVVTVKTEVCIETTQRAMMQSTLARELAFVSTHAVHHFALIKVIAKMLGASVDSDVGLAPASASFLRSQQPTAS